MHVLICGQQYDLYHYLGSHMHWRRDPERSHLLLELLQPPPVRSKQVLEMLALLIVHGDLLD